MKIRLPEFTVVKFAIFCVASTSTYLMVLAWKLNNTLSGPGWCATALGAGKASSKDGSPVKGLEACVGLLTIQLNSLSLNSHILLLTFSLCLAVLIIIVIAGAHVSADTKFGKLDIDRADVPKVQIEQPADKPVPVTQEGDSAQ